MSVASKIASIALALAFLVIAGAARAGDVPFPLKAEKDNPGASGSAFLGDSKIRIQAAGLRPNGVYTVWFVNMEPKNTRPELVVRPTRSGRTERARGRMMPPCRSRPSASGA